MGLQVKSVASGGLPVVDCTARGYGIAVDEVTHQFGLPVTRVLAPKAGLAVCFVAPPLTTARQNETTQRSPSRTLGRAHRK